MWMFWLIPLGFFTGAYGSLVGVGGGFILVPALLMLHRGGNPAVATSISLAVISVNALSGSFTYARMNRIDYLSGILFALATIPGAIAGALTTITVPRVAFEVLFGTLLLIGSIVLLIKPSPPPSPVSPRTEKDYGQNHTAGAKPDPQSRVPSNRLWVGIAASIGIGFLASFFGIGGGLFHVPMMIYLLQFPVHVATATSQFILAITSLAATTTHIATGALREGWPQALFLAVGVIFGAQVGAYLSCHLQGSWIVRALALALGLTGVKFVMAAFGLE